MKKIIDTSLRDGEQAPGVVFTLEQRKRIAEMLVETGVDEIEAGTPAMAGNDTKFLRWCRCLGVPVSGWCRAVRTDIEAAKRAGLEFIHISIPVSDRLLRVFNKNRGWVEKKMVEYIELCFSDFSRVNVGFMDASRADREFLKYLVKLASLLGYDRVRLADTAGIMHPSDVIIIHQEISNCDIETEFHSHNDLGMATANALTALDAGADSVSATVLGIGERAGNARLEEIMFALKVSDSTGLYKRFDLGRLRVLAEYISGITGRPMMPDKAVVGSNVFCHEAGIHASAVLKDPLSFMPANPDLLGLGKFAISAGRHSGSRAIQSVYAEQSVHIDRDTASRLLPIIREKTEAAGRNLNVKELEKVYHEYISCYENRHCRSMQAV